MEGIHGVDVSWLHHPNKDHHHRPHAPSSPGLARDVPPPTSSHGGVPMPEVDKASTTKQPQATITEKDAENVTPSASPKQSATPISVPKTVNKRPSLLGRSSSEKPAQNQSTSPDTPKTPTRRGSWISSLSSKFSSQNQSQSAPQPPSSQAPSTIAPKAALNGDAKGLTGSTTNGTPVSSPPSSTANGRREEEDMSPYVPQPPKSAGGSFFSTALKRLSSGSQLTTSQKTANNGAVCARKVMNIDRHRPRCLVPELDDAKLRRVAFCVDVEIAGGPRYTDEEQDPTDKKKREKGIKIKEKGEGAALKNPQAAAEEKENDRVVHASGEAVGNETKPTLEGTVPEDAKEPNKKKEKKKRSEEERKERKEKRRRKAEESGVIPVEVSMDPEDSTSGATSAAATPPRSGTPPKSQDRPTTDPVRIYRRCCQLRETPVLKRISEQLSSPSSCALEAPGIVSVLDLTGSRLQLADVITLGDWLAVVPVKRLVLEDADLTDEGVRVILAGLLAAKSPEMSSRRHYGMNNARKAEERTGVVEKLVLKNNPRITKHGWKHISLFLYMCRSLKAIDVSMVTFPQTAPASATTSPGGDRALDMNKSFDSIADIFSKSISERLGGAHLEELILAECGLTAQDIRKIVDAVTISGLRRLGLAGNHLDDEGLDHVLHFVKSGVCEGLDIGGNDMRDRLDRLADVLTPQSPLWALCLADCNLTPASLKTLFPALVRLPCFRFIDLSHNRDLFSSDPSALGTLRKYIPQMHEFKRLHLVDVSMSPSQAISLVEVLPEGPNFAHLSILGNPQLSALASPKSETEQEEACALYASLMIAARVSESIICIDIDPPSQDSSSEVVKALAKQVVAYCLRNIQRWATSEDTESTGAGASAASLDGGETEVSVPEVLLHLVGQVEGFHENHDADDPAPDDDYIVGGTGVVKALSYVLGEKARRTSMPPSGTVTPKGTGKLAEPGQAKAMDVSKSLLSSARKIRTRLRPALVKEANAGDELAYRRLMFLDSTLNNMIQRFEDEYPECRLPKSPTQEQTSDSPSNHSRSSSPSLDTSADITTPNTAPFAGDDEDEDADIDLPAPSSQNARHNSDVSLASRALGQEEGEIHRLGQRVRRDILRPETLDYAYSPTPPEAPEAEHLSALRTRIEELGGGEIRDKVAHEGWEAVMQEIGANAEELKQLKEGNPSEWLRFREAQLAAQQNMGKEGGEGGEGGEEQEEKKSSTV